MGATCSECGMSTQCAACHLMEATGVKPYFSSPTNDSPRERVGETNEES